MIYRTIPLTQEYVSMDDTDIPQKCYQITRGYINKEKREKETPASRGEGTGNTDKNDLLALGEAMDGDSLMLIGLVAPVEGSIGKRRSNGDRRHLLFFS